MTTKTKKAGRQKIEIDFKIVAAMCQVWSTEQEIADSLKCSVDTLYRRCKEQNGCNFAEYYKSNNSSGKISLRRAQYKHAVKGNASLLIWLGKQYLGQRDQADDDISKPTPVSITIQVEDAS